MRQILTEKAHRTTIQQRQHQEQEAAVYVGQVLQLVLSQLAEIVVA